jgi:hypothetical protein
VYDCAWASMGQRLPMVLKSFCFAPFLLGCAGQVLARAPLHSGEWVQKRGSFSHTAKVIVAWLWLTASA